MWFDLFTVRFFCSDMPLFTRNKLFSFYRNLICPTKKKKPKHRWIIVFNQKKSLLIFHHFKWFLPYFFVIDGKRFFSFGQPVQITSSFSEKVSNFLLEKFTNWPQILLWSDSFSLQNKTMDDTHVSYDHLTCYYFRLCEEKKSIRFQTKLIHIQLKYCKSIVILYILEKINWFQWYMKKMLSFELNDIILDLLFSLRSHVFLAFFLCFTHFVSHLFHFVLIKSVMLHFVCWTMENFAAFQNFIVHILKEKMRSTYDRTDYTHSISKLMQRLWTC